ncbi:MAG: LuxR C-terminal-related transcriptional regulator [Ktedonobacteraceae bacterium]
MALGDSGRARDVMTEQPTGNPPPIWREEQQRVRTRLLLNDNQIEAALAMLPPLLESAETQEYLWGMIKILLLQARAFQAQGRRTQALSLLARALVLAEPEGFVRTFVDEGPPLKTLVLMARDAVQKGSLDAAYPVSATYVQQILVAFTSDEQTQEGQAGSGSDIYVLADPLSERELEILRLIATGKSNQEIAEELVIAMSTLKTHINRMYSKLAVRNRTQAIAQARKLLLL